jgi:hypothetical protein
MTADTGTPRPAATTFPPIPLHRRIYGLGSIYGKTLRDSRLAFIMFTGLIAGLMLIIGQAWGTAYGTVMARGEIAKLVENVPPIMAGIAGPIVKPDLWAGSGLQVRPVLRLPAASAILALSSTLAGEARRGSLDIVAAAPFGKRRIALEKLAAHLTVMTVSMVFLAVAASVAGSVFGNAELGDAIPPVAGVGFALWVGLMGLVSGAVAFALAPAVGRASAAGVGGAVLLGMYVLGGYAPYVPAFEWVAKLSWFHWTYDHVPLAGQFDWPSLGLVGLVTVIPPGVELSPGATGVMNGIPVPGLPRATLGVRSPEGRAFGDQLPQAIGWGAGIGIFGFLLASVSRTFADQLTTDFPTFADLLRTIFPGVDLTSSGWFLQLVFVEMGLIVVGFSAATFVGKWASDEETGRLEMLLATPMTGAVVLAGGIGRPRDRNDHDLATGSAGHRVRGRRRPHL